MKKKPEVVGGWVVLTCLELSGNGLVRIAVRARDVEVLNRTGSRTCEVIIRDRDPALTAFASLDDVVAALARAESPWMTATADGKVRTLGQEQPS